MLSESEKNAAELIEVCFNCGERYRHLNDGKRFACPACGSPKVNNPWHWDGDDPRLEDNEDD